MTRQLLAKQMVGPAVLPQPICVNHLAGGAGKFRTLFSKGEFEHLPHLRKAVPRH